MLATSDQGCECTLKIRFNNVWPTSKDLFLRLYTNDKTPATSGSDTTALYTEATGGGYAEKTLANGSWTVSSGASLAQAAYAMQTFTFTGPLTTNPTIYGYYVVDDDDVLQFSERFTAAVTPVANGNYVNVSPVYKASNGTPV